MKRLINGLIITLLLFFLLFTTMSPVHAEKTSVTAPQENILTVQSVITEKTLELNPDSSLDSTTFWLWRIIIGSILVEIIIFTALILYLRRKKA